MTRPTKLNYVTCPFGYKGSWAAGYHTGIDYRAPIGTPIMATKKGKVVFAGTGGWGPAYGKHVILQSWHRGRRVRHMYAHLSGIRVRPGQKVLAGGVVGRSGVTGNVSGPHLHYEERVSPFGYWNHRRPRLTAWQPRLRKRLRRILRRIGVLKRR